MIVGVADAGTHDLGRRPIAGRVAVGMGAETEFPAILIRPEHPDAVAERDHRCDVVVVDAFAQDDARRFPGGVIGRSAVRRIDAAAALVRRPQPSRRVLVDDHGFAAGGVRNRHREAGLQAVAVGRRVVGELVQLGRAGVDEHEQLAPIPQHVFVAFEAVVAVRIDVLTHLPRAAHQTEDVAAGAVLQHRPIRAVVVPDLGLWFVAGAGARTNHAAGGRGRGG